MKRVYILRVECNAPIYAMTDEEFCDGLIETIKDEFGEEIKYVKLKAERVDELEANQNQKAIECLKEMREKLYNSAIQVVGTGVNAVRLYSINEIFDNKIKELEIKK